MGPRIGPGNSVGHVIHVTPTHQRLIHHRRNTHTVLRQTGDLVGDDVVPVISSAPPVLAPTGLQYYTVIAADGSYHLYVANGDPNSADTSSRILLSSLDTVNPGGLVTDIHFGYHPGQADSAGRIVFVGEFLSSPTAEPSNPANITTSIVVGIPV
jgi:hypothetical protein